MIALNIRPGLTLPDYMVLPNNIHGACLWTLLTLFFREPNFPADFEVVEVRVQNAVAMEIDLPFLGCFDETEAILAIYRHDLTVQRHGMRFHIAPNPALMIFELTRDRLEGITQRDAHVLMRGVLLSITTDDQFPVRNPNIDADVIVPALTLMAMLDFHSDTATDDLWGKLLKFVHMLTNFLFQAFGTWHPVKDYLQVCVHR